MANSYRPYTPDTWPHPRSAIVYLDELKAAQLKRRKFNVTEFYRMVPACILGEDTLEELIDGDVMVRAYQTPRHSSAVSRLIRVGALSPSPEIRLHAHCPIRLDDYNEPVADVALLADDFNSEEHPGPDDVALAIEIADTPDEVEYDQNIKLRLYASYDIRELWLFQLQSGIVEVHRQPTPEGYADVQVYRRGDTLTIQELPDVRLTVDELLQ